ncbi:MAG TPA: hypothetical protein VGA73_01270 [Candidatus Binatia bacterium]
MKNWMLIVVSGLLVMFLSRLWREGQARAVGGFYLPRLGALFAALGRRRASRPGRDDRLARLEEVLRSAEVTNNGFFQSLQMVQRNLEAVIARAENAEQRLHGLLTETDVGKADPYASAALLLAEGRAPDEVARMLGLPVHQIRLVQKLRDAVRRDPKPLARKAAPERAEKKPEPSPAPPAAKKRPIFPAPPARAANGAAHREKDAAWRG